jgi:hypothetical protein
VADPPPCPGAGDDTGVRPDRGSTISTPRWVKLSGIIVIILTLLVAGLMLFGDRLEGHGPGRHKPGGDPPPSSVTEHGMQQP